MVSFKNVNAAHFEEIKTGLEKLFNIIPYPSNANQSWNPLILSHSGLNFPLHITKPELFWSRGMNHMRIFK